MKQYRYTSVKETSYPYPAYGIQVAEKGDPERIVMFISDVSCDQRVAERIAKLLTDEQLDPIHVYEVLDDML